MKQLFALVLLALVLIGCTGTKADHDPVALIVAVDTGTINALQLVETRSVGEGTPMVLHPQFMYNYTAGVEIKQLLAPGRQRSELWVLYTQSGNMFLDMFQTSSISLANPEALSPQSTLDLGTGNPTGFAVSGNRIAVTTWAGLFEFDRAAIGDSPAEHVTVNPFNLAPVFLEGSLFYWDEGTNEEVQLVAIDTGDGRISFGKKASTPPAVGQEFFDGTRLVHVGEGGHVALYDPSANALPVTAPLSDLQQNTQQAFLLGNRLLVQSSSQLRHVALRVDGAQLSGEVVGSDSISNSTVVVPDPYNLYAFALTNDRGTMINVLVDAQSEPTDTHAVIRNVDLSGLGTPIAGEAFIVQGLP